MAWLVLIVVLPNRAVCGDWKQEDTGMLAFVALEVGLFSVGMGSAVANGLAVHRNESNSLAWTITGYTAAAGNIGWGISILALWGTTQKERLALAVGHICLGVLDLGLTIWSSALPEKEGGTEVKLSVLLIPDSEGQPAFGVGLNVVSW